MKKIILLSAALMLFFNASVMCQLTDNDVVIFNADLQNVFNIQVMTGNTQTALFDTPAEYNLGIPVVGNSTVIVESTDDWYCEISGPDLLPGTGTGSIPVDNIGLWCESLGAYAFGDEVTCAYTSLATCMGITNADQMLWELGTGTNAGGAAENNFRLNWAMGTMSNASMHATSMLAQMTAGDFTLGTYQTTITLTATQY